MRVKPISTFMLITLMFGAAHAQWPDAESCSAYNQMYDAYMNLHGYLSDSELSLWWDTQCERYFPSASLPDQHRNCNRYFSSAGINYDKSLNHSAQQSCLYYRFCECNGEFIESAACALCCTPCKNCTTSGWTTVATGTMKRIVRVCSCSGKCNESEEYKCIAGYYGPTTSANCKPCPTPGSSNDGATNITQCYIKTFSDQYGNGHFENPSACSYKQ